MAGAGSLVVLGLLIAVVAAAATAAAAWAIARELGARRRATALQGLLTIFGPAAASARDDPRQLLHWYPLAEAARTVFPEAFRELDAAMGRVFPFSRTELENAHARWTTDWLSWERNHDFEYKLRASAVEEELERRGELATAVGRARLEQIEREKLERYQERYQEYVRVAKALAGLQK